MKKIIDIALKDLTQSFRSPFAIGMMFAAPLLIIGLIYFAFGDLANSGKVDLPDMNVLVHNADQPVENIPNLGETLIKMLQDERMPDWLTISTVESEMEAREEINAGHAGAAILIPTDFSAALVDPEKSASLTLVHDPTLTITPGILLDLVRQFTDGVTGAQVALSTAENLYEANDQVLEEAQGQKLAADYSQWYAELQRSLHHDQNSILKTVPLSGSEVPRENPFLSMLGQITAGMLVFFAFFTAASSAQSILREDDQQTLQRLFTTPNSRTSILTGKLLAVLLMVLVQAVVLMTASALIFGIHWGAFPELALIIISLTLSASGFGILLLSTLRSLRQSGPVIGGVISATGMMGGLFTGGIQNLPQAFNTMTLLVPQGWAMRGLKLILDGGPAADVLPTVFILTIMGIVFFAIGAFLFNRRFSI